MTIPDKITATSLRYGVDPALAIEVARKESGFSQAARGTSGEVGVFQLMPGTARDLGVDPNDLDANIDGGVRYLKWLLDKYAGDRTRALAAYNGGPGNMDRGTVSSAAWAYAADILSKLGLGDTFSLPSQGQAPSKSASDLARKAKTRG